MPSTPVLAGPAARIQDRELAGRLERVRSATSPAQSAPTSTQAVGASYTSTLVTLTANQAAGTDPVLAANTARKGLVLSAVASVPVTAEWNIAALTGAGQGVPFGPEPSIRWDGTRVPTNAIYVRGFTAGDKLLCWQA
jgi:hypothetical protein